MEPGCGYLFSVCWSVSRPLVFAIGTGQGQVLLYDLKVSSESEDEEENSANMNATYVFSLVK